MKTAWGNFQTATKSAVGLEPYSNFDREKDEAATLELRKRIAEQEARKLRSAFGDEQQNQLGLTRTRLTGSASDVRLTELARDRQRELTGLKGTELNTDGNRSAIEGRYGEQINAERENKRFTTRVVHAARSQQQMTMTVARIARCLVHRPAARHAMLFTQPARELAQQRHLRGKIQFAW